MASDEFGHAAQQETLNVSLSMRTNHDQIGTPLGCGIDDSLSDVTYLDGGVRLESCAKQSLRNSLDQFTGWLFLIFQLGSITCCHLRGSRHNRLQHMQNPDLRMLSPKLRDSARNTSPETLESSIPIRIFMTPRPQDAIRVSTVNPSEMTANDRSLVLIATSRTDRQAC